jgi:hypothetical protein
MSWMKDAVEGFKKLNEEKAKEGKSLLKYYALGGVAALILVLIIINAVVR